VIVGVAVLVLLGAGVAFALLRPNPEPTAPSAAATTQTTTPRATPTQTRSSRPTPTFTRYSGSLEDLLIPMPPGAVSGTVNIITPEMSPAEQTATLWNPADPEPMTATLTHLGLDRNAIRAWQDGTHSVILNLLQFGHRARAADWTFDAVDGLIKTAQRYGLDSGLIPDVIGSNRWAEIMDVPTGNLELRAVFGRGDLAVVVLTATGSPQVNLDALLAIVAEQYERLPPG
jgi:hypothetical protein